MTDESGERFSGGHERDYSMFCYQCEQTFRGQGCTNFGVCGKDSTVAALQDLLVHATKGIAQYAHEARKLGARDRTVDGFVLEALFTTVTNVNFDAARMQKMLVGAYEIQQKARALYEDACGKQGITPQKFEGATAWKPADTIDALVLQGLTASVSGRMEEQGEDVTGCQELLMYGIKGTAAYAQHARVLGKEDDGIYADILEELAFLAGSPSSIDDLLKMNLKCGDINYRAMALLDSANTETYGHPVPTAVRTQPVKGKALLVSGHDLKDLEKILRQTDGKGINVYTHGEMLPAHGYPEMKKYKHLVGNYGGAWQMQALEFDAFPGPILMTTNCIQAPLETYQQRIFTSGVVAWPEVQHIADGDFTPVIDAALASPGFAEDGADDTITVGFGHNAVLGVAGAVVDAVKGGALKHFFLVGGCDGAKPGRNYFTEFAQTVPDDCVVMTLGCGKYRFNKLEFGDIGGIPRLLDIGQCNDAYSAIQIAVALAGAFECGVNDLPLSLVISWYEQKAVAVLLTLLNLGIKNIRLGPSLPAFLTPAAVQILVDTFGIAPITTPAEDMAAMLA